MSKEAGAGTGTEVASDDFVAFLGAGDEAAGEFRCSDCGYGVSVQRTLPLCPMCGGTAWEQAPLRSLALPGAEARC